ncbi:uncharacterized protein LOC105768557 isoform X5 [Gossypium raimondii]|uniref:uncharacterized protein LOC105768557 isoform X5 n=1 Tax=Gossypium raimondii TaxID=29730 RepID=UPI00227CFDCA|nr:uncharacterized protein LOC105768557 isoform X5 [Gossypium raimondii]
MDSSPVHTTSSLHEQEDEWGILTLSLSLCLFAGKILINGRNLDPYQKDRFFINTDGFVIPSLGIEEPYETKADTSDVETSKSYSQQVICKYLYLYRCQESIRPKKKRTSTWDRMVRRHHNQGSRS